MGKNAAELWLEKRPILEILASSGVGFIKGSMLYALPMAALARGRIRRSLVQRAISLGGLVAVVRLANETWLFLSGKYHVEKDLQQQQFASGGMVVDSDERLRRLRFAICGALGTFAATQLDPNLVTSIVVLWMATRAFRYTLLSSLGLPDQGKTWQEVALSTIFMILSAGQILATYMQNPAEVNPSYLKFLNVHGGQRKDGVLKAFTTGGAALGPGQALDLRKAMEPRAGHVAFGVRFFLQGLKRGIKVYLPLYVVTTLLFSFRRPSLAMAQRVLRSTLQSSLFLSWYCTSAWLMLRVQADFLPMTRARISSRWYFFRALCVAGFAVLLEKPGRRMDLATYCLTYALDTLYRRSQKTPANPVRVRSRTQRWWIGSLFLSFNVGVLLYHYSRQPRFVTSWLLKLRRVWEKRPTNPLPSPTRADSRQAVAKKNE